jgi:hypothetical protein
MANIPFAVAVLRMTEDQGARCPHVYIRRQNKIQPKLFANSPRDPGVIIDARNNRKRVCMVENLSIRHA